MLSHFTWHAYLTSCGVLLTIYYLVIALVFFNKEISRFLSGRRVVQTNISPSPVLQTNLMGTIQETPAPTPEPNETEVISSNALEFSEDDNPPDAYENESALSDTLDELEQLSIRLRAIMESYGRKANRTELSEKIRRELMEFSARVNPESFKEAVNQFIKDQTLSICNIRMEPADLRLIWSKEMI